MKAAGVRISWADLPTAVHDAVAATLDGAVVEAGVAGRRILAGDC